MMFSVFANGLGRVVPKIQKMEFDAYLFNTEQYKVTIEGKVDQSRERSNAISYTVVL